MSSEVSSKCNTLAIRFDGLIYVKAVNLTVYIRNTPNSVPAEIGEFMETDSAKDSTFLVSTGSIIPSSQSLAEEK